MGPRHLPRAAAQRLRNALSTIPDQQAWRRAALLLLLFGLIALPLGFHTGFLQLDMSLPWQTAVGMLVVSFLFPALTEELLFRVLLLPHPRENATRRARWLWAGLGLALFVASHPVKALALFPAHRALFMDPAFLLLAGLLGLACTVSYLQSGSIWPPVVIHWLVVVIWLIGLGGYRKLYS